MRSPRTGSLAIIAWAARTSAAGLTTGLYPSRAALASQWRRERLFEPRMGEDERAER